MAISARQVHNILVNSVGTDPSSARAGFISPIAVFTVSPNGYSTVPASLSLGGTIDYNSAQNLTWTVTSDFSANILASGTSNVVAGTILAPDIPSALGSHNHYLNLTYQDSSGNTYNVSYIAVVTMSAEATAGQLPFSIDVSAGDFGTIIPLYEGTFAPVTETDLLTQFDIVTTVLSTGRLVIIVPYAIGAVIDIEDNTNATVLNEFSRFADIANSREIFVTTASVTPGTYTYKVVV
jgi:hypothetical protein